MRFSHSKLRKITTQRHQTNTARLGVEPLENRRMLAAFELSSLLAANGGDGSAGFIAVGEHNHVGSVVSVSGDVNGDGFDDLLLSDPELNPIDQPKGPNHEIIEGAAFVVFGTAQGIPAELDLLSLDGTNGITLYGNPHDDGEVVGAHGKQMTSGGDINGDGVDDIIIAGPGDYNTDGRIYVLYGNEAWGSAGASATIELETLTAAGGGDGSAGFVINRPAEIGGGMFGVAVDGDVNADGVDDLVIGSAYTDRVTGSVSDNIGQAFVVYGKDTDADDDGVLDDPFSAEISLGGLDGSNGFTINGMAAGDYTGFWVSGGDLNSDGIDDIVVGAVGASPDSQRDSAGQIFVLYGTTSFPTTLELSDILAGDGTDGFVINGIRGDSGEGDTFVAGDRVGATFHSGGDFNGDGINDLAIGAPRAANASGAVEVGEAYIVFGRGATDAPFPVALELTDLDGTNGVTVHGLDQEDSFGRHVVLANVNSDAYADLVVTAPGGDPDGRTDAGETYVVFGRQDVPVGGVLDTLAIAVGDGTKGFVINGIDALDYSGGGTAFTTAFGKGLSAGDFNGDGADDLAIGIRGGGPPEGSPPEAYVVFGGEDIIPPPPAPSFSIDDVAIAEGDSGTVDATFTITRAGDSSGTDSVDFATADGTATTADNDYQSVSGTLSFAPGVATLPVTVTIVGDTSDEGDETFLVNLTNPSAGATVTDATGVGTIENDDASQDANVIYVWDIQDTLQSRQRGKNFTDYRIVVDIRQDSDVDGVAEITDAAIAGVAITVEMRDDGGNLIDTLTGLTNEQGLFESEWIKNLTPGDYRAEVTDLALAGFAWDPFDLLDATDNDEDEDGDGRPDDLFTIV